VKWDLFEKPGFMMPFSVAAYPAISVCAGFGDSGLPVAIQLVGKPFQEPTVFRVADAFEEGLHSAAGARRSLRGEPIA
jgi:aspartyl-tRNA(Asn)/glutamyl-tRNA(Gln) amidotransferase subunit A